MAFTSIVAVRRSHFRPGLTRRGGCVSSVPLGSRLTIGGGAVAGAFRGRTTRGHIGGRDCCGRKPRNECFEPFVGRRPLAAEPNRAESHPLAIRGDDAANCPANERR